MSNNSDNKSDQHQQPPQHLFSDYVEIAYLGLVICAGLALNICVLKRLLRERRRAQRSNKAMSGFLLLKLNLNVSDILILLIHASGKLSWLITYEWRFGACLCRLFNLSSMFTLYLSSNIVICIALDRLLTVIRARRMDLGQRKLNMVRLMLTLAWTFSLLFSLPQLVVWTTYNPFKDALSQGWVQCTDIWSIDRYERYLSEQIAPGSGTNRTNEDAWSQFILQPLIQNIYELTHLFLVFYGPLIALVFCYALISTRLIRFAANNPCSHSMIMPQSSNDNTPADQQKHKVSAFDRRQLYKRASVRSFPAIRLYSPIGAGAARGGGRRKSHHLHHMPAPMVDIVEVSTRAEEPSNATGGGGEQQQQQHNSTQSMQNISNCTTSTTAAAAQNGPTQDDAKGGRSNLLVLLNGHHKSNSSLPVCALRSQSAAGACGDEFPGRSILQAGTAGAGHLSYCCQSPSCRVSISFSSSSSFMDLKRGSHSHPATPQQPPQKSARRILVRIRDSFRESFGKRQCLRRHQQLRANLHHCSSTSSLCGGENGGAIRNFAKRVSLVGVGQHGSVICPPIGNLLGRGGWWGTNGCNNHLEAQKPQGTSSSSGRRQRTSTKAEMDGPSNPDTAHPHLPASSSSYYQNGGGMHHKISSAARTPCLASSVRSSFSTSMASTAPWRTNGALGNNNAASGSVQTVATPGCVSQHTQGQPLWRRHLRSRAFRTTLLVILVHILLWSPYNVYALMKHVNQRLYEGMSERANVLKDLQFLITLINPFLYGFGNGGSASGRRKNGAKVGRRARGHNDPN